MTAPSMPPNTPTKIIPNLLDIQINKPPPLPLMLLQTSLEKLPSYQCHLGELGLSPTKSPRCQLNTQPRLTQITPLLPKLNLSPHKRSPKKTKPTMPNWVQYLKRGEWHNLCIAPKTTNLILEDSNLARCCRDYISPANTHSISLSSAKWTDLLQHIPLLSHSLTIKRVIVHMGYNDLSNPISPFLPKQIVAALQLKFPTATIEFINPTPHPQANPKNMAPTLTALFDTLVDIQIPTSSLQTKPHHIGAKSGTDYIHLNKEGGKVLSWAIRDTLATYTDDSILDAAI